MKKEESIQKIIPTQELLTEVDSLLVLGGFTALPNGNSTNVPGCGIAQNPKCIINGNCVPQCVCPPPATNTSTNCEQICS